jgi:hypothetical protein
MRLRALAATFAISLALAACGSEETDDSGAGDEPTTTTLIERAGDGDHGDETMDHTEETMDHTEETMDHGTEASAADEISGFAALSNGHHGAIEVQNLDTATQTELDAQLEITREVAEKYATVADAKAAGYRRAGPFSPGLGVHMVLENGQGLNPDGVMDDDDLRTPLSIIYSSHEDDGHIVGFMYYSSAPETPEGFAGPNDVWHFHTAVCITRAADGGIDAPYGADGDVTEAQCNKVDGSLLEQTQYMVHVWTAPGYEMPDSDGGVFGEANRKVACSDGSYHMLAIDEWPNYPYNVCTNDPN